MKESRIFNIIVVVLIFGIVMILTMLTYDVITNAKVEENRNENIIANVNNENTITNNESQTKNVVNEIKVNPTITENTKNDVNPNIQKHSIISKYYYSQLNEFGKTIYDGLEKNKSKLIDGNVMIDYGDKFNTLLHTENGKDKLAEAFQSAWNAFSYDNVDLFYIDISKLNLINEEKTVGEITTYTTKIGAGQNENYYQASFKNKQEVEQAQKYIDNIVQQIVEQTKGVDDYNKIESIHNWMISYIEYETNKENNNKNIYNLYGTLVDRKAVCEGYARTFKYLMDSVDIPCVLVTGKGINSARESEDHAWNYVKIRETWYGIDVTWDDPIVSNGGNVSEEAKHKYFLKGSEEFLKTHKENGKISENSITFEYPKLSNNNYK